MSDTPPRIDVDANALPAKEGTDGIRFQRQLNVLAASVVILVGVVYLLMTFATILQHVLVALFLVYLLTPPYRWLVRHRVPPLFSCILMVAGLLVCFTALGILMGNSFADLQEKLPRYRESLGRLVDKATTEIPGLREGLLRRLHGSGEPLEPATRMLQALLQALSIFLSQSFVVLIYLFFMLAERGGMDQQLRRAFTPERADAIQAFLGRINASITEYIMVKTLMSLLGGVLTWAILLNFGVDYAVLWGLIAFLLNFIPYAGSIVATVLPVLLSLVQFEDPVRTLAILVLLLVMQNAIGYLIEPRLAGQRLDIRPLVIILALAFWGTMWGIVGMILAVPLVVVIKAILEQAPATRPLARMLANG